MTALEALAKILQWFDDEHYGLDEIVKESEEWKVIEKSLKALEIIRDKEVNVNHLVISDNLDMYNYGWEEYLCILTQEEYDLLKEVLNNYES